MRSNNNNNQPYTRPLALSPSWQRSISDRTRHMEKQMNQQIMEVMQQEQEQQLQQQAITQQGQSSESNVNMPTEPSSTLASVLSHPLAASELDRLIISRMDEDSEAYVQVLKDMHMTQQQRTGSSQE
jgi:type II secretory pathway pseudopilin PulG